jgi:hypothetical protein
MAYTPPPPAPIVINFAARSVVRRVLSNEDVGGRGLDTRAIERVYGKYCRTVRYSRTAPGVVVIHPLSRDKLAPDLTLLGALRMYQPGVSIRLARRDYLRSLLLTARYNRQTDWTDEDLEDDLQHLLTA